MKTLIVEDDFTSRVVMQKILKDQGPVHIAVNGKEAVEAARLAVETNDPYNLICLDIMMPEMDGHQALKQIRMVENNRRTPRLKADQNRHHHCTGGSGQRNAGRSGRVRLFSR